MTLRLRLIAFAAMTLIGLGWGLSVPLSKVAVSTGYRQFGVIFWQLLIGAVLLTGVNLLRGRPLPRGTAQLRTWIVIALTGSLIPGVAFYSAISHLPAGIVAIVVSLVPVMALPMAIALRLERFSTRRLLGLMIGLSGTLLLILPDVTGAGAGDIATDRSMLVWVPVAMIAPLCYAIEGNYVARFGTAGLDPLQVMLGATILGCVLVLPAALATGQFISPIRAFGAPETALVAYALLSVLAYSGYVWLVGMAGAVFAMQVSYLVTAFGVIASWLVLGERYAPDIWVAFALVMVGIFLVQPRRDAVLAPDAPIGDTATRAS